MEKVAPECFQGNVKGMTNSWSRCKSYPRRYKRLDLIFMLCKISKMKLISTKKKRKEEKNECRNEHLRATWLIDLQMRPCHASTRAKWMSIGQEGCSGAKG